MRILASFGGIVLGVGAALVGVFFAFVIGLAMAGSGDRGRGSDVLFCVPFGIFAVVSLVPLVVPALRRAADGMLVTAGVVCAVLLVAGAIVGVVSGIQRL